MTAQLDLGPTGKISRTAGKAAVHDQKGWSFPAEFDRLEKGSGALLIALRSYIRGFA